MRYRIEVSEFESVDWVLLGTIEKTERELDLYLCLIRRLYPGSRVRAVVSSACH